MYYKPTMQEWADFLNAYVAKEKSGDVYLYLKRPRIRHGNGLNDGWDAESAADWMEITGLVDDADQYEWDDLVVAARLAQ